MWYPKSMILVLLIQTCAFYPFIDLLIKPLEIYGMQFICNKQHIYNVYAPVCREVLCNKLTERGLMYKHPSIY